jgi:flagellin
MDLSIESVGQLLATNGSTQSRLLMAMESLRTGATQIEQAHGQIADANIAQSSSELSRSNILIDASATALAQAKELPKTFLGLLNA